VVLASAASPVQAQVLPTAPVGLDDLASQLHALLRERPGAMPLSTLQEVWFARYGARLEPKVYSCKKLSDLLARLPGVTLMPGAGNPVVVLTDGLAPSSPTEAPAPVQVTMKPGGAPQVHPMAAQGRMAELTITKEIIQSLPLASFMGTIAIVTTPAEEAAALAPLVGEKVLGLDTETQPSFRRGETHPTALLQVSGSTHAVLYSLLSLGMVPPGLASLLADETITKVGTGIEQDVKLLFKEVRTLRGGSAHNGAIARGLVNLSLVCKDLALRQSSLQNLAGIFLGVRISKKQQTSNWGHWPLNEAQLKYAAMDAWVARESFLRLRVQPMPNGNVVVAKPSSCSQ